MSKTLERVVEETREAIISAAEAKDLARSAEYRFSDAMREGSQVTTQTCGWGNTEQACALSAAGIALRARGII